MKRVLLFLVVLTTYISHAQNAMQFTSSGSNGWLTPANWATGLVPGSTDIAVFNNYPAGNGSNNGCNIAFNDLTTNNGSSGQIVGAIRVMATRTSDMNIGNSSTSVDGTLSLAGVTIGGTANVVVENLMPSNIFYVNNSIVGNNRLMALALPANAVFSGAANSTTQVATQVSAATNVTVNGGTLQLNRRNGATFPSTTNFTVSSGTLKISSDQVINNLDLAAGATLLIDNNTTLTINGTFKHRGGTVTKSGGTSLIVYGAGGILEYCATSAQSVSVNEWPTSSGPSAILVTNTVGVTATGARTVSGAVTVNGLLDVATYLLTTGSVVVNNGGTLKVGSTDPSGAIVGNFGASAAVTLYTGSTVEFNGSAAQFMSGRSFSNLTLNNNSGVSMLGNVTVSAGLSLTAGTLTAGSNTLTLSSTVVRTAGSIAAPSGGVVFNGTLAQAIAAGVFSGAINTLTVNNAAGVSAATNVAVSNSLVLTAGTLLMNTNTLTLTGSVSRTSGMIDVSSGTLLLNGTAAQTVVTNMLSGTINNLTVSNSAGVTMTSDATLTGSLSLTAGTLAIGTTTFTLRGSVGSTGGNINAASGTFVFNGTAAQSLPAGVFSGNIANLTINNSAGVTAATSVTVANALALTAGTFAMGSNTLTLKGNVTRTTGVITAATGTVVFNGTAVQSLVAGVFSGSIANLTVNNAAGVTTASDATITNLLTLTAGTYDIGTSMHTLTGSISNASGILNAANGTIVFNGSSAQAIPAGSISTTIKNLTVNNTANLTINANHTVSTALVLQAGSLVLNGRILTIGGTVSGAGTFTGSAASGLTVAATGAAGTLNFNQSTDGTTNALATFAVSAGSATLGGKLNLYTALNVSGGSIDFAAKNLVLKSLSSNTARVAPVTGTITNATNVTVERWFPNDGRKYRFITSGVTTTTSIKANWMEGGMNTSFCSTCNVNPVPGYGTQITGTGGNTNGFDVSGTNYASLFTYNQATSGWTAVTSTGGTLNAMTPYLIFIRGDRSVDMTATGNTPVLLPGSGTTLRATGTLPTGTKTFAALAGSGKSSLVSNPYPSPISWASIYANNSASFENYYTYFEPKIGQRGAFVTVTNAGLTNNAGSTAQEQIQSGQGFLVTTKSGVSSPSLVVREVDKSTTANVNVFRTERALEKFFISLNFRAGGQKFGADGVLVAYGREFTNIIDGNDAVQVANWDEDIAIDRGAAKLSIETRQALAEGDSLPLSTARLKAGTDYEWQLTPQSMGGHPFGAYLVDRFLVKETPVSLTDTTYIPFTVTNDPASAAPNRFAIVFKTAKTLPVTFTAVKAVQDATAGGVQVEWQTANESTLASYEVERSADGRQFATLATARPKGGVTNTYQATDHSAKKGSNYYRVKSIDLNGNFGYSPVVVVRIGEAKENVAVYPNPIKGSAFGLQLTSVAKEVLDLQVHNSAGAMLVTKKLEWEGGSGSLLVQLPATAPAGYYTIRLRGQNSDYKVAIVKE